MKKIIVAILVMLQISYADVLKENFIDINLNSDPIKISLDFGSVILEEMFSLDDNQNKVVSWNELKAHKKEILPYVFRHFQVYSDGQQCRFKIKKYTAHQRGSHQSYIKLDMHLLCPKPEKVLKINYDLFFTIDKNQKAFVRVNESNQTKPIILSQRSTSYEIDMEARSTLGAFKNFLIEGIWHIWIGFDHILFLLMLLLPAIYYYENKELKTYNSFKKVFIEVAKIVTAFSVAHSITLVLSVIDMVDIDSRYIEIAIALSVLFTAINNLFGFIKSKIWFLAFGFGLIHGFGFANVLKELLLEDITLVGMLFGFNVGVEIGQLIIVLVILPYIFLARESIYYRNIVVYGGSFITAIIAAIWAYERYANVTILGF
jgi:hypothetical protein